MRLLILFLLAFIVSCSENKEDTAQNLSQDIQIQDEVGFVAEEKLKQTASDESETGPNNTVEQELPVEEKKIESSLLEIHPKDIVLGDKNSKVIVIEYVSPTCPHCAYFHKNIFPKLQDKFIKTSKIAYVMRNFIANKQDLDASILAYCSNDSDKFLKFTNVILQQQDSWAITNKYREILTNIGRLGGVSGEEYVKCLQDNELLEFLMNNSKAATKSPKFVGTPAFFINGEQFSGAYSLEALSDAIEAAVNKENQGQ